MKHTILNKVYTLAAAALLAGIFSSCERKPLYLQGVAQTKLELNMDIQLDIVWDVRWKTEWQYNWDETIYGPIGYVMPDEVRATIYSLGKEHERSSMFTRNFPITGGEVSLTTGMWYDMLFFNSGTEYILFEPADDYSYYHALTRQNHDRSYSRAFAREFKDMNQPDPLYGAFLSQLWVSNNPDDYRKEIRPDGTEVYIYEIDATLEPYTYIYLIQIVCLNNRFSYRWKDSDPYTTVNRIQSCDGVTVGGMAAGTDLMTRHTFAEEVSVTSQGKDIKPFERDKQLTLPDSTKVTGDIMATRIVTWGLPNMSQEMRSRADTRTYSSNGNEIGIGFRLWNGRYYNVTKDITEQVESKPKGGVITVVFDASEVPDSLLYPDPEPQSPFNASVEDWENVYNAEVVI